MTQHRTGFGQELHEGENLRVLSEAKEFFDREHQVTILRYFFTKDVIRRPKGSLQPSAYQNCSVCGKELYRLSDQIDQRTQARTVQLVGSAHMQFVDMDGKMWPTCFKLKTCFRKVGFFPTGETSTFNKPPSCHEFLRLTELADPDAEEEMVLEAMEENYMSVVFPFLLSWANKDISKRNYLLFRNEFRDVIRRHVDIYYEDADSKEAAARRILTVIGVEK